MNIKDEIYLLLVFQTKGDLKRKLTSYNSFLNLSWVIKCIRTQLSYMGFFHFSWRVGSEGGWTTLVSSFEGWYLDFSFFFIIVSSSFLYLLRDNMCGSLFEQWWTWFSLQENVSLTTNFSNKQLLIILMINFNINLQNKNTGY